MATNFGNRFERDELGRVIIPPRANRTIGERFHWTGREHDQDSGLQYNRGRCFDPTQGRWLSADPLAFDGTDQDLYPYPTDSAQP